MAGTTLLSLRPTRLIILKYYVAWIFAWVLAVVLYWDPWNFFPTWKVPLIGIALKTVLAWFLGFLGLLAVLIAEVRRLTVHYILMDNRIITQNGIIRRSTAEIPYTQIERVELKQGLLQRMLGYGNILIDTGDDMMTFASLRHVKLVYDEMIKHVGQQSRPPQMRSQ